MNPELKKRINDLQNTIRTWELFLIEVLKLKNEDIIEQGLDFHKMVWTQNEVDYYFDHSTLDLIDFFIAKKGNIITDVRFSIPNYIVRNGKADCEKYIKTQMNNLSLSIKSLQQK